MTTSPFSLSDTTSTIENRLALRRLVAVGFLADFMLYLVYTAVPFKALSLGAESFQLGLLAAVSTGTYALLAGRIGRWTDGGHRSRFARAACVLISIGCIGLTMAPSIGWMLCVIPVIGGSMAPFWPSVQASLADRSPVERLSHNLGSFNLAWSTGKACGFFLGGILVAHYGVSAALTTASCVAFVIFFLLPGDPPAACTSQHPAAVSADNASFDVRAPVFRSMAWIANGTAFGLGATLNHHYPRLLQEFGWRPDVFGLFLGGIFLVQSLTFLVLRRHPHVWRFRRARLYGAQVLMIFAVLTLPFADLPRLLLCALFFGGGLGICYHSSIYYSLHAGSSRGRNAGVHESLVGLGSMLIPFLGGWLAKATGLLAAPYMVAGLMVGFSLLAQEVAFQKGRPAER